MQGKSCSCKAITLCVTWKLLIALLHKGKYGDVRKHAGIFQAGLIEINYVLWCFILELFKINVTLLQCKIEWRKKKCLPFFLETCLFSHVLVQAAASIVSYDVFLLSISLHPSDFPGLCFWYNIYVLREIRFIFCLAIHTGPGRM